MYHFYIWDMSVAGWFAEAHNDRPGVHKFGELWKRPFTACFAAHPGVSSLYRYIWLLLITAKLFQEIVSPYPTFLSTAITVNATQFHHTKVFKVPSLIQPTPSNNLQTFIAMTANFSYICCMCHLSLDLLNWGIILICILRQNPACNPKWRLSFEYFLSRIPRLLNN